MSTDEEIQKLIDEINNWKPDDEWLTEMLEKLKCTLCGDKQKWEEKCVHCRFSHASAHWEMAADMASMDGDREAEEYACKQVEALEREYEEETKKAEEKKAAEPKNEENSKETISADTNGTKDEPK